MVDLVELIYIPGGFSTSNCGGNPSEAMAIWMGITQILGQSNWMVVDGVVPKWMALYTSLIQKKHQAGQARFQIRRDRSQISFWEMDFGDMAVCQNQ